ncbi:MAG TPA: hypothetical protein VG898_06065 [Solirubrobacterales bacterium]|nr:hypothetical protein [Solirubrobacterales bacterium]
MHRKLSNSINPASLLAMVALFVALSGVSYAATKIGTNGIKNGAVNAKKLKRGAVTTVKIRDNAVTGDKVAESSLDVVPKAKEAEHAATAGKAEQADKADAATDAEQLGGVAALQFGSGVVGAAVTAPPAAALAPSGASGAPIGSGDEFQLPVPVPLELRNMVVKASGDLSRPFVASLRNPGGQALSCAGVGACAIPGPVAFKPGDVIELAVSVLPGPAIFAGATYQVGYRITP